MWVHKSSLRPSTWIRDSIAQQSKKDLLGDVIEICGPDCALSDKEFAQRQTLLLNQALRRFLLSGEVILYGHNIGRS
jgi:hypothetical protein